MTSRLTQGLPRIDDGDLLARLASQDVEALETLYDRYSRYVYALSWQVLRERRDAEEVVQDVFWQLWTGTIRHEPSRGRFATWLYAMARNRSIDRLRRRNVAGRSPQTAEVVPEPRDDEDPETQVSEAQRRLVVRQALEQLSDDQRRALELSFYEGLSHREVAERLSAPLGTVKSRIRTALTRLKTSLEVLR